MAVTVRCTSPIAEPRSRPSSRAVTATVSRRFSRDCWACPRTMAMSATRDNGSLYVVDFRERDMADRVAKAMTHAIDLCGGARKEAF